MTIATIVAALSLGSPSASAADSCGAAIEVGPLASAEDTASHRPDRNLDFQRALFAELSRRTGCQFSLLAEMPRARQWKLYLAGKLAIVSSALPVPARDAVGWFEQYQQIRNVLVMRKDHIHGTDPAAILGASNVTIGVVRGYSLGHYWDALLARSDIAAHLDYYVDIKTIFHMIDIGRVDAVITTQWVYDDLLPIFKLNDRVSIIDWPAVEGDRVGLYLSRKALPPQIAQRIGRALEAAIADQSIVAIYRQTMQRDPGDSFDFPNLPLDFTK
jgi:hypothetical protein